MTLLRQINAAAAAPAIVIVCPHQWEPYMQLQAGAIGFGNLPQPTHKCRLCGKPGYTHVIVSDDAGWV